ncbi:TPA: alpha-E domain-containing protein [Klebsiella quasipneumoniae subsp. quasipneumoniae]|uniref:alpha-E domain-containing protein n=1 Tax=Klebsiella pneumoniae complex TaxID=3390273 RepID=UPI000D59EB93|nr:alpha-E domain-containing protein [Klebsiella pneumoniae]HBW1846402.1 alpha-E domain-containing protein [Klebsiella quasipneumoniae subsp. quasipneumoniae]HCM5370935.1 alpha-E domain-containing protein [Klebsiella variicola subsp. variicola]HDS6868533.1 alpha-E domain-containing protein [Klebsiella pneumoniae subsp. pneumoniae]HBX8239873.1 alpha-E domain-containing protein [Klebsiella pneumoniae]HCM7677942.1 alpha-E domain-containing protein [Klebsiella quasipneumoniae subsp. quasipneumonia
MLSRVAERLYWSARYLERVENTARLIMVYNDLLYDLPRDIAISWYNLIEINRGMALFAESYTDNGERNVLKFLLADDNNPGSLLSSLKMVRENIRTTRDAVPAEMWELINELDIYAQKNIQRAINRSDRHTYLNTIIEGCQKIIGLLAGSMSRDCGWHFLNIGCYLERADMNTRILDAAITLMLQSREEESVRLGRVVWSKVLSSQSAYLRFRRNMHCSINGAQVVTLLLGDEHFPRSQRYCLQQLKHSASELPHGEAVSGLVDQLLSNTRRVSQSKELNLEFSSYLNDIQLAIIALNNQITSNWFRFL